MVSLTGFEMSMASGSFDVSDGVCPEEPGADGWLPADGVLFCPHPVINVIRRINNTSTDETDLKDFRIALSPFDLPAVCSIYIFKALSLKIVNLL